MRVTPGGIESHHKQTIIKYLLNSRIEVLGPQDRNFQKVLSNIWTYLKKVIFIVKYHNNPIDQNIMKYANQPIHTTPYNCVKQNLANVVVIHEKIK